MQEYNLLTRRLLAEGYTAENYPDYVMISGSYSHTGLDNFYGGFQYRYPWIFEKVFKTGCGLQCKGVSCQSDMSYMRVEWTYENNLATVRCPYRKEDCTLKHELLQGKGGIQKYICNVHLTDEEYQYEMSVEKIWKLYDDRIGREKLSFALQKRGRVCQNHMHYDHDNCEWKMHYDPFTCARSNCIGRCPILGRELDTKKGNVYYDVKTTGRCYELDGTLFEGERYSNIIKGKRMFDHPVSLDICKRFVKLCKDEVVRQEEMRHSRALFFAEWHGREFSMEVLNIRAEYRESRDLLKDLQDIRDGLQISHASDIEKSTKAGKRKRREQSHEKRNARLEKKLLEVGYWNFPKHSLERRHADKWLSKQRIQELENIRQLKDKEEQEKPIQLSLFD